MDPVMVVVVAAVAMLAVERMRPGRGWRMVPGWWSRALLLNTVQVLMVFLVGATWDRLFPAFRLWDAGSLGVVGGALTGYLVITFVYYWWHRARHEVHPLWRWLHQIHHSPQRIEIITSFYKHPLEILINGALSSFVLYAVVGLGPEAGAAAVTLTGLAELFYHWNVRTPYWIGFFIQRPESHCVHHRRGWHRQNFSDLPLWDMLFGTFHNPRDSEFRCGFAQDRERHLSAMLVGRDVNPRRSDDKA